MKKHLISITVASLTSVFALSAAHAATSNTGMTEDQKTLYALGNNIGNSLAIFSLSPAELDTVKKGLGDAVAKTKPSFDVAAYMPKIQALAMQRGDKIGSKNASLGKAFAAQAAKEHGAQTTASGLVYISMKDGSGESPALTDTVKVHYRGTFIDGKEFDSSYAGKAPIEFPLNGVIKCWGEGVQKMKVGGKARLVCPASIAYGKGTPDGTIPAGSTLNFEVELLGVQKKEKAEKIEKAEAPTSTKPAVSTTTEAIKPAVK